LEPQIPLLEREFERLIDDLRSLVSTTN